MILGVFYVAMLEVWEAFGGSPFVAHAKRDRPGSWRSWPKHPLTSPSMDTSVPGGSRENIGREGMDEHTPSP